MTFFLLKLNLFSLLCPSNFVSLSVITLTISYLILHYILLAGLVLQPVSPCHSQELLAQVFLKHVLIPVSQNIILLIFRMRIFLLKQIQSKIVLQINRFQLYIIFIVIKYSFN